MTFKGKSYPEITDIVVYPIGKIPDTAATKGEKYQLVTCRYIEQATGGAQGFEYVSAYMTTSIPFDLKVYDPSLGIKTYVAKRGDTLHSVTAAMYGKDTAEGRQAIVDANPRLRNAETAVARNEFWPGFRYAIPWNPADMKTVRDFLDAAAKEHDWVRPHYAWWKETRYSYVTWMGGCFLVFGVVIPALIRGISGGRKQKEGGYDLERFSHSKEPAKQPTTTAVTQKDMDQLAEIEAALQASLKSGDSPRMTQAAPAETTAAPAVRVLNATKAEPIQPTTPAVPEEEKVFGGEYYPVAKTVKKHD